MSDWLVRTGLLIGDACVEHLVAQHVLIAGVGGVGGHVAEAIARAGVGRITLIDMDNVALSNLNRQLVSLHSTIDMPKVEVMRQRVLDINPQCQVTALQQMICHDAADRLAEWQPTYVIDAIDSLSCKVALLQAAYLARLPTFSSMGAGRRIDGSAVYTCDLMQTEGCALARSVRQRLRKLGVGKGIRVVASRELPRASGPLEAVSEGRARAVNGTISYLPALFGTLLAGEAIKHMILAGEAKQSPTGTL